jgi:hypothetical protein
MAHNDPDPIAVGRAVYIMTVVGAIAFALAAYLLVS